MSVRHAKVLSASVAMLALLVPAMAAAQPGSVTRNEVGPGGQLVDPQGIVAAETADSREPGDDAIVVTGTRIVRPELAYPNPVQSFTIENIRQSGDTNLTDFLVDTPALASSTVNRKAAGSETQFQESGLNLLNLRGLGVERTLTLVNGRRHVGAFPGTAAVDVNTIPVALLERVDVLTGGVSAIYGADGVTGVVNFVLRRDFEGIQLYGQTGMSNYRDARNHVGGIVVGRNLLDDRLNLTASYEIYSSDRVSDNDRPFMGDPLQTFQLLRVLPPADRPDVLDVFDRALFNDLRWQDSSRDGAWDLGRVTNGVFTPGAFDGIPDFTGSGQPYDRGTLIPQSGGMTRGGSGNPIAGYTGDLQPQYRRQSVNLLASYAFSESARLFAEGKYVKANALTYQQPTIDFGLIFAPDNPYLQQRFGTVLTQGGALLAGRDNVDYGLRGERSERELFRGVLGLEGRLSDHLRYEVSFVAGRSQADVTRLNDRIDDRYAAALDAVVDPATGLITCRINLPGETVIDPINFGGAPVTFTPGQCVPANPFGFGLTSQESLDFFQVDHTTRSVITQQVASGFLSGDTGGFFQLPGGPIQFAVGAEYRRESSRSSPPAIVSQNRINPLDFSGAQPVRGSFNVREVFAEVNVPIIRESFFHNLSVGGAVRFSDYSTVGSATTWNLNGVFAPVRDITFRGTYSQAVRAPNVSELFQPEQGFGAFITDPCDITRRTSGTQFRAANCEAQLAALGLTPAQIAAFNPLNTPGGSISRPGIRAGNPDLQEETAKTWTAGVALRPRFIPGFSLTLDYYDIRLRGAIRQITPQELFNLCVDQPTLENVFCSRIQRSPATGFASGFRSMPENVATFHTSGADVTLNYRFTPSPSIGTFNVRLVGGYLRNLTLVATPVAVPDENSRERDAPKYIGTMDITWTRGPLTLNYGLAWQDNTMRYTREELAAHPDIAPPEFLNFSERWEHDFQIGYDVRDNFNIYAGVNNFTNREPDIATWPRPYPMSPVGRYFYIGVRVDARSLFGF